MTTDPLVKIDVLLMPGVAEWPKFGVHLCLFGLTAMCLGYNAIGWTQRRERHLAVNVGIYAALALFECRQLARHLDAARPRKASV